MASEEDRELRLEDLSDEDEDFTDSDGSKSQDDIPSLLKEFNEMGVTALKSQDDTDGALDALKRCEQFLENLTSDGKDVDRN